ncbi:MAG: hypothetical protein IPK81_21540 [Rhodospirillales bacterium]|nr:MAG: hypothetical protein IPK81_21540 [Rhodospirillales bacterium]
MARFKLSIVGAAVAAAAFAATAAAEPERRQAPARGGVVQKAPVADGKPYIGGSDDGSSIRRKAPAHAPAQAPASGGGYEPNLKAKPQ